MATVFTNRGKFVIAGTGWDAGTYLVALATSAFTPTAAMNFASEITNELSGGGYARQTLAGRTTTEDDGNNRADLNANNAIFAGLSSTQVYKWACLIKFVTNDADSPLIAAIEMHATGIDLTGYTSHEIKWAGGASSGRILSLG